MGSVRPAAVAGAFYPADPHELDATVGNFLAQVTLGPDAVVPKAIIAPHAGHVYSGPIAASAYARLVPARGRIERVVLIGPSHRVGFRGLALATATAYASPLGQIRIDTAMVERLKQVPATGLLDQAHAQEHSLEVHLPFLQKVLGDFALVPVVAGEASAEQVAALLDAAWGGPETLIVVSTDLSHYLDYETCRAVDAATTRAIEAFDPGPIGHDQACGWVPVSGLLVAAKRRGMVVKTLDVRTSGDTAGDRDRVVGYGAWAFLETDACAAGPAGEGTAVPVAGDGGDDGIAFVQRHGPLLVQVAAASIRIGLGTGQVANIDLGSFDAEVTAHGAAFVTLTLDNQLRGCIGSAMAWRPLLADVVDNAFGAAFKDPRFRPVSKTEVPRLELSVSVLTPPRPMEFADQDDLLRQIRPGVDGLIFEDRGSRGLFLPQVWESLPEKADFLMHLKQKANLPANHWSPTVAVQRFTANAFKSHDLPQGTNLWAEVMESV